MVIQTPRISDNHRHWLQSGVFLFVLLIAATLAQAGTGPGRLEFVARDPGGQALEHVVVSLHARGSVSTTAPGSLMKTMDQRDLQFTPTVLAVQAGTKVNFPNEDDVRHHVYSFSHPNAFELKLYHGEYGSNKTFEHEGVVVLGCNIHDGMLGYVRVVDTPYYATSDASGDVVIPDVPPGKYDLQIWHPDIGMKVQRKVVSVSAGTSRTQLTVAIEDTIIPPLKSAHPLQSLFRY